MRLIKSLGFILLTLAGVAASAQTFEVDGINYNVLSEAEGTVEVTSGDYSGDVVIPAEVSHDGSTYRVTTIGSQAFYGSSATTSVSMPSVITIGDGAFIFCNALTSVEMPSVTTIGEHAFGNCSSLTSVFIPASCTFIAPNPFEQCTELKGIVVDDNNPNYSSADGVLYDKGKTTLISWPTAEGDIDILPSVTTIGDWAFYYCNSMTSVSMSSVTMIGNNAFSACSALTSISMPAVTTMDEYAFSGCYLVTSVSMPAVTTIGDNAFSGCSSLASVFIPSSCTSIGDNPFEQCIGLKEIMVDENNPNYSSADGALYDKGKTTLISWPTAEGDIDIMPSVTTIGSGAFSGCSALTSVSMPAVTTIGVSAFSACSALTSLSMPLVETLSNYAFSTCQALTSVYIPASCTSIGFNPFMRCCSLQEIIVDDNNPNYTSLDGALYDKEMKTFVSCPGVKTSINLPASVEEVRDYAFYECTALTSVSMPSVRTIGDWSFWFCSAMVSVSMPAVTTIGANSFSLCGNLSKVDIPASVSMIGGYAFTACNGLTSVYCHWEQPLECDPRFDETVLTTATLYVPDGCVDAYRAVKPWSDFTNIEVGGYSGVADTPQPEVTVKVIDGVIVVEGGDGTASAPVVEVYSTGGLCIYRGTDSSIGGLPHGVYVVRVGSTVQKVAL